MSPFEKVLLYTMGIVPLISLGAAIVVWKKFKKLNFKNN